MKNLYKEQIAVLKELVAELDYPAQSRDNNYIALLRSHIGSLDTQIEQSEKNPPKQLTEEQVFFILRNISLRRGRYRELTNMEFAKELYSELLSLQEERFPDVGKTMYPAEFVEWMGVELGKSKSAGRLYYQESTDKWFYSPQFTVAPKGYTLPELFEYWRVNVQGK